MHIELYDVNGMSLVPVPADALATVLSLLSDLDRYPDGWSARMMDECDTAEEKLRAAANSVQYHGADGGPPCEMEEYHT